MRVGGLLALAALVFYLVLRQGSGHGDGPGILLMVRQGEIWTAENHFLYVPVLWLVTQVLAPLGVDAFTAGGLLSAFATAVGVWFVHAACRRLSMSPGDAALVTMMTGFAPAVVYFATAVELHGFFFAFAGFAMLRVAVAIGSPTPGAAIALGAATGLAFAAHATAHLVLPMLLAIFWAERRSWPDTFRTAALAIAAHVVVVGVSVWLAGMMGSWVSVGHSASHLQQDAAWAVRHPELIAGKLLEQWVWPFLLPSVVWLLGIRAAPRLAFVTGVSLAVYFAVAFPLAARTNERGAYFLPLAWPAAWLVVRALPGRLAAVVAAATVVYAGWFVVSNDDPEPQRSYAAGLREIAGDRTPFLLIGSSLDIEACGIELPDVGYYPIAELARHPIDVVVPGFDRLLARLAADGKCVLLTEGGRDVLEHAATELGATTAHELLAHIDGSYRTIPVEEGAFRGWRLAR